MKIIEKTALNLLHRIDPELSHGVALAAMKAGIVPLPKLVTSSRLKTQICGLQLQNPVGLAAGYDKNASVVSALTQSGFGFVEVGAVTPRPQSGNPKPRLFRLREDQAVINRFGFNNNGMKFVANNLHEARRHNSTPLGLNLGANKDSTDRAKDFVQVFDCCQPYVDFVTVNVSSPNTENLRDLQGPDALKALLKDVILARETHEKYTPVFLKIAPDLTDPELRQIADVALSVKIDGIVATNTTITRDGLVSHHKSEVGGLSGRPLFKKSTQVLAKLYAYLDGEIPLIGVGGISSAEDAYAKICAGAISVQLYSALAYQGLSLVEEITRGLDKLLLRDGYDSVNDAVGSKNQDWLLL